MSRQSSPRTRYDRTIDSVRRIFCHQPSVFKRKTSDYSYTPLEDHHIRLLELRPGSRGTNLYVALQHLRHASTPRRLWVDAICINQQDTDERSRQVERMADIYQSAGKVVIWLGPEEHGSRRAIEALDQLASKLEVDWITHRISAALPHNADTDWLDLTKPAPFDDGTYQSIYLLFKRAWFTRLWIWQEVFLARDSAVVSCGDSAMTWTSFTKAVLCLGSRPSPRVPQEFFIALLRVWPLCIMKTGYLLGTVLYQTRFAQCSDKRDRVYGILNIVVEYERFGVKPDYNKSDGEVYQDVMVRSCSVKGTRSLLSCCELNYGTRAMASWIPDWSVPRRCKEIENSRACGKSSTQARLSGGGNNILKMVGVPATHVTGRFEILPGAWPHPDQHALDPSLWATHEALKKLVVAVQEALLLPRDQQGELLCLILFINLFSERWEPEDQRYPAFYATTRRFLELTDTTYEVSDAMIIDSAKLLDNFYFNSFGRAFIITSNKGMIGLAPDTCRENDCIVILLGCESPMVLRPTNDGYYTVVGECYVHGLMEGEALLGPLPAHCKRIVRYDEGTNGHYDVFVDREQGEYNVEDPRLGPLPEGWYREEHPEQHLYTWFRHQTREDKDFTSNSCDPRMLPESLRERGIKLQEFALI
ncbi:MAG: hypothetical protein Q9208_001523 [Pyrenodesmia sp. 3 TL-2023]